MAAKTLGQQLAATLDDVAELIEVTHDPDRLKELQNARNKLVRQIAKLVEANLDSASQEYKAALRGLKDASTTIRDAIKGLESVANAVESVAEALDLISELAPK